MQSAPHPRAILSEYDCRRIAKKPSINGKPLQTRAPRIGVLSSQLYVLARNVTLSVRIKAFQCLTW